jgi:hypothetical protein
VGGRKRRRGGESWEGMEGRGRVRLGDIETPSLLLSSIVKAVLLQNIIKNY